MLISALLIVLVLSVLPRFFAVEKMPVFLDEILWLSDGLKVMTRLEDSASQEEKWPDDILRHPGVPTAIAAGLAEQSRDYSLDRVEENERIIAQARYGVFWLGILCCLAVVALGTRLYDLPTGIIAGVMLALSPMHIANSAWLQCDSSLTTFSFLSIAMLAIRLKDGKFIWLIASAICGGLAVAAKLPGILIFAMVPAVYICRWYPSIIHGKKFASELTQPIIWLAVALVTLYLAWPRMWGNPLELWDTIRWASQLGGGHLNYFMGQVTSAPPWYYYLVVVPLSSSPTELIGAAALLVSGVIAVSNKKYPSATTWILTAWLAIFLLAMSLSGKKLGARYVLPILPVLVLLAARALSQLVPDATKISSLTRQKIFAVLALVGISLSLATLVRTGGYFHAYGNEWLGGTASLNQVTMVTGVMEKQVAEFADTLPAATRVSISGHTPSVAWHAHHALENSECGGEASPRLRASPPDYLIVFSYMQQRCPSAYPETLKAIGADEIGRFIHDGATLATIYTFKGDVADSTAN